MNFFLLCLITFVINVPTGYVREYFPRMSLNWLLVLHSPVPLIVYLRWVFGISISDLKYTVVPILIVIAVVGQLIGSRMLRPRQKNSHSTRTKSQS